MFNGGKSKYALVVAVIVLLYSVGVGALKFLQDPPQLQGSHVGWSVDYNCTTDDPNATVSVLQSNDFGFSYNVISVTPKQTSFEETSVYHSKSYSFGWSIL